MGNLGNRFPFPSSVCMPWLLGTWIVGLALARSRAKNLSSPPCLSFFLRRPKSFHTFFLLFLGGWKEGPPPPPPSKPVAVLGSLPFPPPPSPFLNRLPPPELNQLTSSSFGHRPPPPPSKPPPSYFPLSVSSLPAKKPTRAGIRQRFLHKYLISGHFGATFWLFKQLYIILNYKIGKSLSACVRKTRTEAGRGKVSPFPSRSPFPHTRAHTHFSVVGVSLSPISSPPPFLAHSDVQKCGQKEKSPFLPPPCSAIYLGLASGEGRGETDGRTERDVFGGRVFHFYGKKEERRGD